jgi:hypothetical protein
MIELINPLFTTLILIISVTVNGSNATTVSEEDHCYDQVGDANYCYESIEECTKVWKSDDMAESPCYNEFGIETINNFVNGVKGKVL